MKRLILLPFVLLLCASPALAQQGTIGLYADPGAVSCETSVIPGTILSVYVAHILTPGAMGAEFRVIQELGANLLFLADVSLGSTVSLGDSQSGISVAYGGCFASVNTFLRIDYFVQFSQPPCSQLRVVANPNACTLGPLPVAVDCAAPPATAAHPVNGGTLVLNPDASCGCLTVPTEESSWGRIKSLYHE